MVKWYYRFKKGVLSDDQNTVRLPRQDFPIAPKTPPESDFFDPRCLIYQRFTNLYKPDLQIESAVSCLSMQILKIIHAFQCENKQFNH